MLNPMYDTGGGAGDDDANRIRANVLYEPGPSMTAAAATSAPGSFRPAMSAGPSPAHRADLCAPPTNGDGKTPAASGAVATSGAVYLVPSKLAATRSGASGDGDPSDPRIVSTATAVKLIPNMLYAGGSAAHGDGDGVHYATAEPAATDSHAYAQIDPSGVPPSTSGYVNISIEVMAAALSELPTLTRSEAEKKLAEENVDGGFMLRQRSDSTTKVVVSCVTKGVYEHYIMELVEDADKKGAKWLYKSQPLHYVSMVEAATELLKDKLVHSQPQLLQIDGEAGGVHA